MADVSKSEAPKALERRRQRSSRHGITFLRRKITTRFSTLQVARLETDRAGNDIQFSYRKVFFMSISSVSVEPRPLHGDASIGRIVSVTGSKAIVLLDSSQSGGALLSTQRPEMGTHGVFFLKQKYKLLEFRIAKGIARSPLAMELFLNSLWQKLKSDHKCSLKRKIT